jgi:hypothetical protein
LGRNGEGILSDEAEKILDRALVERLTEDIKGIKEDISVLKEVMTGDVHGKPGIVHTINDVRYALWDKDDGLAPRIVRLEKTRTYAVGWIAGAGGVGALIVSAVEKFFGGK